MRRAVEKFWGVIGITGENCSCGLTCLSMVSSEIACYQYLGGAFFSIWLSEAL